MANDIFIARQPILDADRRTFGYELLYRDGPEGRGGHDDPDRATQSVIERAFLHWGMERLIGDRFGLINAHASLIDRGLHRALPPEGIIFELCDDGELDRRLVDSVARARNEGYHFALDNANGLRTLERSAILPYVSMVKVETSTVPDAELDQITAFLRTDRPGLLLVAEKVESHETLARSVELGFDLFQGYFFAEPEVLGRSARPTHVASALALLAEIQRDDIDLDRIEQLIGSDPSLAYRVLAVVNSSAFGLDRRVDSLQHAIVLLGLNQVRHLATLLTLSASKHANEELITLGATRARLTSTLVADRAMRSSAFTVGLLSVTDALYRTPMDELVADLPLSDEVSAALLHGSGELGRLLAIVRACEQADVDRLEELAPGRIEELREAYAESTLWADTLRRQLTGEQVPLRTLSPAR